MSWGTACCRRCPGDVPLISTYAFSKFEFYCMECGTKYTFMGPRAADEETPELDLLFKKLQAEWDEHAGPFLRVGKWWYADCEKCSYSEYHCEHATDEERRAHEAALKWMEQRAGKAVADG